MSRSETATGNGQPATEREGRLKGKRKKVKGWWTHLKKPTPLFPFNFFLFTLFECLLPFFSLTAQASTEAYYRYLHGLLAERSGDMATAIAEYEKVVELDPHALQVYKDLAQLNLRTGRTDAALRVAEKVKTLAPDQPSSFLFLGYVHVARGDLSKAADQYEKALELDPRNLRALENLGNYYSASHPTKALSYYQKYLDVAPHDAVIHFQMGVLHQRNNEMTKAVDYYQKSIELDPQQTAPHAALADIYELQKSTEAAIAEYETCLRLNPRNPALYARLGHLYFEQKKWDEAWSQFETARILQPYDASTYYWLARIAEEKKQWSVAGSQIEKAYQRSGDPQFLPILSYYLTLQGKTREAIRWLEKARRLDSQNANVLLFLGMNYLNLNKLSKAREALEIGVELSSKDAQMHFQLGIVYDRLNLFEKAVPQFTMVLRLDPKNAAAMNYIGYSYGDRGIHLKEAETLVREAVKIEPQNGAFLDSLGWIRYKQGDRAEAIHALERAVQLTPDAVIYEHLGDVYWTDGQPEAALHAWTKSLAMNPHQSTLEKRAREAAQRVLQGSDQRKILKYIEGNFRQISHLQATFIAHGRWKKDRLKVRGDAYYLRPDRFLLTIWGPTPTPLARLQVKGQSLQMDPPSLADSWSGFDPKGLVWFPRFFSSELLAPFDSPHVKTTREGSLVHYYGAGQEAWVDIRRGVLTRLWRNNPSGGRDVLEVKSYQLVEGLWLPGEIRLENTRERWKARIQFSQWEINSPEAVHAFESPAMSFSHTHP